MKPRARRVTIAAAVLGAGVVGILVVAHWGAVRDHVEAWHFQLTRKTETIMPGPLPDLDWSAVQFRIKTEAEEDHKRALKGYLSSTSRTGRLATYPVSKVLSVLAHCSERRVIIASADKDRPVFFVGTQPESTIDSVRMGLEENRFRIVEQRFPRRAYVVIRDPAVPPTTETLRIPVWDR